MAGEKETDYENRIEKQHVITRERESRHRPWTIFPASYCNFNALVRWFRRHCWFRRSSPQDRGRTFRLSLHRLWLVFNSRLYLVASPWQLTFEPESSSYLRLVSEEGTYPFPMVPHLHRRFSTSVFLFIFNYHSHSDVTSWPTTGALAWLLS